MSELLKEAAVDLEEEEEEKEEQPSFVVVDDQKAEWCLKTRKRAIAEKEKWKAHYDDLNKKVAAKCDETILKMETMLQPYLQMQHEAGFTTVTKTGQVKYKLPDGTLVLKHQEPVFDVNDDELVPWLEKNDPELVKIQKKADWNELKKKVAVVGDSVMTTDAEIIPGVKVTPREDIFKVEGK